MLTLETQKNADLGEVLNQVINKSCTPVIETLGDSSFRRESYDRWGTLVIDGVEIRLGRDPRDLRAILNLLTAATAAMRWVQDGLCPCGEDTPLNDGGLCPTCRDKRERQLEQLGGAA